MWWDKDVNLSSNNANNSLQHHLPLVNETYHDPHRRVAGNEACCQSVIAECWPNECNHAKRSQL